MIMIPDNISDAMDLEPVVRDIVKSFEKLPLYNKAMEKIQHSDFYKSYKTSKTICDMLDEYYRGKNESNTQV